VYGKIYKWLIGLYWSGFGVGSAGAIPLPDPIPLVIIIACGASAIGCLLKIYRVSEKNK
jgi:hypothetical protein